MKKIGATAGAGAGTGATACVAARLCGALCCAFQHTQQKSKKKVRKKNEKKRNKKKVIGWFVHPFTRSCVHSLVRWFCFVLIFRVCGGLTNKAAAAALSTRPHLYEYDYCTFMTEEEKYPSTRKPNAKFSYRTYHISRKEGCSSIRQ